MTDHRFATFIGFDVSGNTIAVFNGSNGQTGEIANTAAAIEAYAATLDAGCYCICENTGGHEAVLLSVLYARNIPVHRADAAKVKAFVQSFGTRGKTDALDARALAAYGRERHAGLTLWRLEDRNVMTLRQLVLRREELVTMRTAEKNRLKAPCTKQTPWLQETITVVLEALQTQISSLEARIAALLKDSEHLKQAQRILLSVPGIGKTLAPVILASLPELGTLSRRQVASLAGVAPHPKDSGKSKGYRRMNGGRPLIKRALFIAALTAARNKKSSLGAYYNRLIQNGKKPIKAIGALMRKIIVVLNAKMRDHYAQQLS